MVLSRAPRSDELVDTPLKSNDPVRETYLSNPSLPTAPPVIAASPFIPPTLIAHLMRNKKNSALGVKYRLGDQITNMEGCAHTYVTPIVLARMHGDYAYKGYHRILPFKSRGIMGGRQKARMVLISAAIHPDFELPEVMLSLAALRDHPTQGAPWNERILDRASKLEDHLRREYDEALRRHMIYHLVGSLPARSGVEPITVPHAIAVLGAMANTYDGQPVYVSLPCGKVVAVHLLFRSACEQVANEFTALESATQSYVYTYDPPAIFAYLADATLLNRIYATALGHVVRSNPERLPGLKIYAFNDYADPDAVATIRTALQTHPAKVMRKADLFPGQGFYAPPPEGEGALLVLHNNSDAFGQNIETEGSSGSMDGAIGCASSAAASLRRDRKDLLDGILPQENRLCA